MVTKAEKELIYEMIDTIEAAFKLSKKTGIELGFKEESPFEEMCRDSITKGYKIINGHAED